MRNFSSKIKVRLSVLDKDYQPVKEQTADYDIRVDSFSIEKMYFIDELRLALKPQKYVIGMNIQCVRDDWILKEGVYRFTVSPRDYSYDSLTVSDIQLAATVNETGTQKKFIKPNSDIAIIPNPGTVVLRTKPLGIYYEIYYLTLDESMRCSYEIAYTIQMSGVKNIFNNIVSGLFTKSDAASTRTITTKTGNRRTVYEYMLFDISELPPGEAKLTIRVKDNLSGQETTGTCRFTIADPKK